MKKILMMFGLLVTSAAPLSAFAHTDVRIGLNVGAPMVSYRVPAYYDYGNVVVTLPYCPPHRVVYESYYDDYRPVIVYRDRGWSRGWHGHDRDEWRGHERGHRRGHDND